MSALQWISIGLEGIAILLGAGIALGKGKAYGWGIVLTFTVYVLYDLSRLISIPLDPFWLTVLFFLASLSILVTIWQIYRELPRRR